MRRRRILSTLLTLATVSASGSSLRPSLLPPTALRVGRLTNGIIRVGWNPPSGAASVRLRIWSVAQSGGLADVTGTDVLWRETFAAAPATNSTIRLSNPDKWKLYSDLGPSGWETDNPVAYLSTDAGAIRIGNSERSGAIVTQPLDALGDNLTLAFSARRHKEAARGSLCAAIVSAAGTTNWTAQTSLRETYGEYSEPIRTRLSTGDRLVLASMNTSKEARVFLSDVAILRTYAPASVQTNECLAIELTGDRTALDLPTLGIGTHCLALAAQDADGQTSDWSDPLPLDANALGPWRERQIEMPREEVFATLTPDDLLTTEDGLDVSDSPFQFVLEGRERTALPYKDTTKQINVGLYICTNVFARDWIVLVPGAPKNHSDIRDAELRLRIKTGDFAARRIELSALCAQLGATNRTEKSLAFQWRACAPDGTVSDWSTLQEFKSRYTAADATPDLAATMTHMAGGTNLQASAGTTLEARVHCRKIHESGREAPLGFRDFTVCVSGTGRKFLFLVR